jgi:hypothetical protein
VLLITISMIDSLFKQYHKNRATHDTITIEARNYDIDEK